VGPRAEPVHRRRVGWPFDGRLPRAAGRGPDAEIPRRESDREDMRHESARERRGGQTGRADASARWDRSEGPDTDVFVVRAAPAPERMVGPDRMRFFATTNETASRYSSLVVDVPVGSRPPPHVHQERMSGSTCSKAIRSSTWMTARSPSPRATSCTFPCAPPIGSRYSMRRSGCPPDIPQQARSSPSCRTGPAP
jgi:hypothetical protein